jgi:hypothetical protein
MVGSDGCGLEYCLPRHLGLLLVLSQHNMGTVGLAGMKPEIAGRRIPVGEDIILLGRSSDEDGPAAVNDIPSGFDT